MKQNLEMNKHHWEMSRLYRRTPLIMKCGELFEGYSFAKLKVIEKEFREIINFIAAEEKLDLRKVKFQPNLQKNVWAYFNLMEKEIIFDTYILTFFYERRRLAWVQKVIFHELAHTRFFRNHGKKFEEYFQYLKKKYNYLFRKSKCKS